MSETAERLDTVQAVTHRLNRFAAVFRLTKIRSYSPDSLMIVVCCSRPRESVACVVRRSSASSLLAARRGASISMAAHTTAEADLVRRALTPADVESERAA